MPRIRDFIGREEFYCQPNPYSFGKNLHWARLRQDGRWDIAQPLVFEARPAGSAILTEPFMTVESTEMENAIMSALWRAGMRPNDDDYGTGHIAALNAHIKELQGMVQYLQRKLNNKEALGETE